MLSKDHFEYMFSAFDHAWLLVLLLLATSIVYFVLSENKRLNIRLAVSAHGFIFVIAELYSLLASPYFQGGEWQGGEYVFSGIESVLYGVHAAFFALGLILIIFSVRNFEGSKGTHFLIFPMLALAGLLYFISGMTLTRDWI